MTKAERTKRIEYIENRLFLYKMVDRPTHEDRENERRLFNELMELKKTA